MLQTIYIKYEAQKRLKKEHVSHAGTPEAPTDCYLFDKPVSMYMQRSSITVFNCIYRYMYKNYTIMQPPLWLYCVLLLWRD